jgi:ElaB/YqjD/DUF883 family membrane-anchored ribosome-binding protein
MKSSPDPAVELRRDIDAIKDDILDLKTDMVAAMRDLMEVGKSEASDRKAEIEEAVRARLDRLSSAASAVARRGRRAAESAQHFVEEKPFQSLAVAFGIGILLGAALRK